MTPEDDKSLIQRRPAETITGGVATLSAINAAFAGDWRTFTVSVIIGVLPTLVTGWQEAGGCQGIYERVRWGRRRS